MAGLFFTVQPIPVHAVENLEPVVDIYNFISNPNSISITPITGSNKVFQNIFEQGDILFLTIYNVHYTTPPTEPASNTFVYSLYNGTTLIASRSLNYYEENVIAMYFSAESVESKGIVWGSSYKVRVGGNPAAFATLTEGTNMATHTLSTNDWITGTLDDATNKNYIVQWGIAAGLAMQTDLAVTLVVIVPDGQVLNDVGRAYMLLAVPNLDYVVTDLFQTSRRMASVEDVSTDSTYQDQLTIVGSLGEQTKDAFDGIGTYFGISGDLVGLFWILMLVLLVASIAFLYSGNTTAAIVVAIPIVFIGAWTGTIPLWALFTVGAVLVIYMGYYLFLRGL